MFPKGTVPAWASHLDLRKANITHTSFIVCLNLLLPSTLLDTFSYNFLLVRALCTEILFIAYQLTCSDISSFHPVMSQIYNVGATSTNTLAPVRTQSNSHARPTNFSFGCLSFPSLFHRTRCLSLLYVSFSFVV